MGRKKELLLLKEGRRRPSYGQKHIVIAPQREKREGLYMGKQDLLLLREKASHYIVSRLMGLVQQLKFHYRFSKTVKGRDGGRGRLGEGQCLIHAAIVP